MQSVAVGRIHRLHHVEAAEGLPPIAQVDGLADFPVYTRKVHTDVAYIACARKLLAVLAVLEAELGIVAQGQAGNLDELRRERAQSTSGPTVDAPGTSSEGRR